MVKPLTGGERFHEHNTLNAAHIVMLFKVEVYNLESVEREMFPTSLEVIALSVSL